MIKSAPEEQNKNKIPLWVWYALATLILLIIGIIVFSKSRITLEPAYIIAIGAAIGLIIIAREFVKRQHRPSIFEIARKIREWEHKESHSKQIMELYNNEGKPLFQGYRSILKQTIYVGFDDPQKTYEYDLITNKVVGCRDMPLNEIIEEERNQEIAEKIKAGELIVARGVDPNFRGEG